MKKLFSVVIISVLFLWFFSLTASKSNIVTNKTYLWSWQFYKITSVVDWDTVKITLNKKSVSIRLIGIDAPESSALRFGYIECFGNEAKKYLTKLIANKSVKIETDISQGAYDKYDRLLGYIILSGQNINQRMIADGYAREYTYDLPYLYQQIFKSAQKTASAKNLWLRSATACSGARKDITKSILPTQGVLTGTKLTCGTKKTCGEMNSCNEAKYYLTICGLSKLDGDKDGTPCESLCK